MWPMKLSLTSNAGKRSIQIDKTGALKKLVAFQVRCCLLEDVLDLAGVASKFSVHRKKRGNAPGNMRRRHTGPAIFLIEIFAVGVRGAGDHFLAGSHEV